MEEEQHMDHCIVTFMGENWFIAHVQPGFMIGVRRDACGRDFAVTIDTQKIDWTGYCNEAVEWINQKRTPAK